MHRMLVMAAALAVLMTAVAVNRAEAFPIGSGPPRRTRPRATSVLPLRLARK